MMHKEKLNPASVNEDVSFLIEGNKGRLAPVGRLLADYKVDIVKLNRSFESRPQAFRAGRFFSSCVLGLIHLKNGEFRAKKPEAVANRTVSSNPTLSAIQAALVILRTTFHSKCGFSSAKCGDLHL
jgi:hypothetical protein